MTCLNNWWLLYLFVFSSYSTFGGVWGTCNYVLHYQTGIAWSTAMCIPMGSAKSDGSLGYMKFSCPTVDDVDQTAAYLELYTEATCDLEHFVKRTALNYTEDPYTFYCGGMDGCFASYVQGCLETDGQQLVMAPVDTCVRDTSDEKNHYSFMYTCDYSKLVYKSFKNVDCDSSGLDMDVSVHVSECKETVDLQSWKYEKCRPVPGMDLTSSTEIAIDTTKKDDEDTPVFPYKNWTMDDINDYANESDAVAITVGKYLSVLAALTMWLVL